MRRAALAAICVALAAALLAPSAGNADPPDPGGRHFPRIAEEMATTQCVAWKKHSKRVVKRVKRQGEWKRVVRVVRWRTCARRVAPAPTVPTPPPPAPPAEPQPESELPTLPRLGVKAVEWAYTLSRPEVPAGEVVVELNNMGEDPHNLHVQLEDGSGPEGSIATIGPSSQGTAKFSLPAGTYRLWCDLDEHEERGMAATLIVAAG
jgi:plastocyanin